MEDILSSARFCSYICQHRKVGTADHGVLVSS